jgi:coiled-coil domain-containing protein 12
METTEERKARLKALRAAAEAAGVVEARESEEPAAKEARTDGGEGEPALRFRSYAPRDEHLQAAKIEEAHAPEPPPAPQERPPAEEEEDEDGALEEQPRKANWDLRRDVAKKLEKLERRTQRALLEIARQQEKERLQSGS